MWKSDGHYSCCHPRVPWPPNYPPVLVQTRLDVLKGRDEVEQATYRAAKVHFSMAAAEETVGRCVSKAVKDSLIAHTIVGGLDASILVPHPAFDDESGGELFSTSETPRNALPFAYAAYLSRTLGCPIDEEIVQIARIGRTKLTKWPRYLFQPSFGGVVRPNQTYIIADDVVSTGGTMAALRSYIIRNGGHVVFATALANGTGKNQAFSITEQTVNLLLVAFGDGLDEFWTETIGHGIGCLTETEGAFLREWSDEQQASGCVAGPNLLQRIRDQLDQAAAKNG